MRLFLLVLLLLLPISAQAQLWNGILDPTRAVDWSTAGVPGGIPTNYTNCTTAACNALATGGSGSVTAATINSALSGAPANSVVNIRAGNFTINGTISIPSNKILRGAGMTQATGTVLQNAHIAFGPDCNTFCGPTWATQTTISSGATRGSTSIVVASASGFLVGNMFRVTQPDLSYMTNSGQNGCASWTDEGWPGGNDSSCTQANGRNSGQTVRILAVSGTTITFEPALYMTYTNATAHPFSTSNSGAGLESVHLFNTGSTSGNQQISFQNAYGSWVKGITQNFASNTTDYLGLTNSLHCTIRDSYFLDAFWHDSGTNGDEGIVIRYKSSHNLIENNIVYRGHLSIFLEWGASGNVIAYNYTTGTYHTNPSAGNWMMPDYNSHGAHPQFNLFEGNIGDKFQPDNTWGSHSHSTIFRHWSRGIRSAFNPINDTRSTLNLGSSVLQTNNTSAFDIGLNQTSWNLVGVVAGSALLNAQGTPGNQFISPASITADPCYLYGYQPDGASGGTNTSFSSAFIHGVVNCVNGTVTWDAGHPDHTLPASFYLSSKPAWFGNIAWPGIGPDITGGIDPLGRAKKNPAMTCFDNAALDATNRPIINALTCYPTSSGDTLPPAIPTGVTIQ